MDRWKVSTLAAGLAAILLTPALAVASSTLWTCGVRDSTLYQLDKTTGAVISTVTLNVNNIEVAGCFGLAFQPVSRALFAIVDQDDDGDRALARVDRSSGAATILGELQLGTTNSDDDGDYYVGLTFDSVGTLYTLGGGNCSSCDDDSLYTVNTSTGETTFFSNNFAGNYGPHALEFNPEDGFLYYVSSTTTERIDLTTGQGSNVSADDTVNYAFAWDPDQKIFLGTDRNALYTLSTAGTASLVAGSTVDAPEEPRDFAILADAGVAAPTTSVFGFALMAIGLAVLGAWRQGFRRAR